MRAEGFNTFESVDDFTEWTKTLAANVMIGDTEGVCVTGMVARLNCLSRRSMRRTLNKLVNRRILMSRPRGGVSGARRLYYRPPTRWHSRGDGSL